MQGISLYILLDYIYHYTLTFFICLLGAFIKDCYDTIVKDNVKIMISRILISSLFGSVVICAVDSFINVKFSIYVFISLFCGIWGFNILQLVLNSKVVLSTIKNIFKNISSPIAKGISDTITEMKEEDKKDPGK